MPEFPTSLPASFSAGVTIEFWREAPQYPVEDGWLIFLALAGPSVLEEPVPAEWAPERNAWHFTLPSEVTAHLAPGLYRWGARARRCREDLVVVGDGGWILDTPLSMGFTDVAEIGDVRSLTTDHELQLGTDFTVDLEAGTITPISGGFLTDFATDGALEIEFVQWIADVVVRPLDTGKVSVTLDIFTAEAGAGLSFQARMLPILYAAFENRVPKGLEGFQIYNRTVTLMPIEKLAEMIAEFEAIEAARKRMARGRFGRQVRVYFTGTTAERR